MPILLRKAFSMLLWTCCMLFSVVCGGEELPFPDYDNSIIIAMTAPVGQTAPSEIEAIKGMFGGGIYAPLCLSGFMGVDLGWHVRIENASAFMTEFKKSVEDSLKKGRLYGVGVHLILNFGVSRRSELYENAKIEDLRNTQWYNDNNPVAASQWNYYNSGSGYEFAGSVAGFNHNKVDDESALKERIQNSGFTACALPTMSRYARKLKNHLSAKQKTCFAILTELGGRYPDVMLIVSAPGEAEMNYHPTNDNSPMIEYINDYSPFAVLEFRDWIRHDGLYGPSGAYAGQGWSKGGARYRGVNGLSNFNRDFKTAFSSWDLKYYHWSLNDPVDVEYTDYANPDHRVISSSRYYFNSLTPQSGPFLIPGGFDPPREMRRKGESAFFDLWTLFRETMVRHYVVDTASAARAAGFPMKYYFSHQIPADYLFGTKPDPKMFPVLNNRYYSSASPLWTAFPGNGAGVGVTMYDVNLGSLIACTSQYLPPEISAKAANWGLMEYNPEVTIASPSSRLSSAEDLHQRMMKVYGFRPHFISFFKWSGGDNYRFSGTNRGEAAKMFFNTVRDRARRTTPTIFTPKKVEEATAKAIAGSSGIRLEWSERIWPSLKWKWSDWGDFREFVIHRSDQPDFSPNVNTELGRVRQTVYTDLKPRPGGAVYYRVMAVNKNGHPGPGSVIVFNGGGSGTPVLKISATALNFGAEQNGKTSYAQRLRISNAGTGLMQWSVSTNENWLSVSPNSGMQGGDITVNVNATGKNPGVYKGTLTISAPFAVQSPCRVDVLLNVFEKGKNASPFGSFDTPPQGAKVMSNVPFTGWALDDLGIEHVKIYLSGKKGLTEVGTAFRVEGARPDVVRSFPNHPENQHAGWGYMMLTNFLPDGGNGVYTFYAVAVDIAGRRQTLGIKTITCDNAHAVKPFGTIETPAPGGVASGSKYRNWGWVLTPPPNVIPIDGHTISVVVDGRRVGGVRYNFYRSDVAELFPNYLNSKGAFAYCDLDFSGYETGLHTIEWLVKDNAGNEDGIGSRYFFIDNSARSSHSGQMENFTNSKFMNPPSGDRTVLDNMDVIRGYGRLSDRKTLKPGTDGVFSLETRETERLEIHLKPGCRVIWLDNPLGNLPAGAFCDIKNGFFYWLPGPGFLGNYNFIVKHPDFSNSDKNYLIRIKIAVKY